MGVTHSHEPSDRCFIVIVVVVISVVVVVVEGGQKNNCKKHFFCAGYPTPFLLSFFCFVFLSGFVRFLSYLLSFDLAFCLCFFLVFARFILLAPCYTISRETCPGFALGGDFVSHLGGSCPCMLCLFSFFCLLGLLLREVRR